MRNEVFAKELQLKLDAALRAEEKAMDKVIYLENLIDRMCFRIKHEIPITINSEIYKTAFKSSKNARIK